ncbi:uncharacterized protein LOC143221505 [Lasioglossum baleicum]|uniref:uncharacterized protein LOC143221505 n=1 Tax=Lasioglossum baleicum TaxID=434251 RepID=UPI003FCD11D5
MIARAIERQVLRVSPAKTQAIWFHCGTKRAAPASRAPEEEEEETDDNNIRIGGTAVQIRQNMKYLGLVLEGRWTFEDHFAELAPRLERTGTALCRLLPNIGGPEERVRRLYAGAIKSMALYGASIWAEELKKNKKNCARLASVCRRLAIRVTRAYRTLSHQAATVLARLPLLDLLAGAEAMAYELGQHRRGGTPPLRPGEYEEEKKRIRRAVMEEWRERLRTPGSYRHWPVGAILPVLDEWM